MNLRLLLPSLLTLLLVGCAASQVGGGGGCTCEVVIVTATPVGLPARTATAAPVPASVTPSITASATPSAAPTVTPTPTNTLPPTPTMLPLMPTWSGVEHNPECTPATWAVPIKGLDYVYRDPNYSYIKQNVRSGPGTQYSIVGKLERDIPQPVRWIAGAWVSITLDCSHWLYTPLGELLPHSTQ